MKTIYRACAFALAALLAGCSSNGSAQKAAHDSVYESASGLPAWAGTAFENPQGLWAGYNPEKGFYASGQAFHADERTARSAAELDAKINLSQFALGTKSAALVGARTVDRFISDDGRVYVLMFISKKDAKKSGRLK